MYRSFEDEMLVVPESVVAAVVATAALDDTLEFPDVASLRRSWQVDGLDADGGDAEIAPHVDEMPSIDGDAEAVDAWARHARAANGFGG